MFDPQTIIGELTKEFYTIVIVCVTLSLIFIYLLYLLKIKDDKTIDLRDLVLDSHTKRLDYKKLAINTAAILQCFTWWRMSMGLPVDSALAEPFMWLTFYAVVAGHDLLYRLVKIKAAQAGVLNADNAAKDNSELPK